MSISLILQTLLSTAAVMATVLVILFVVTGIGLLTSFSWQQGVGVRIRSAIWLGWFWVAVYVSTAHLFFAMKPPVAVPLIIAGLMGWFLLVRKSGFPKLKLRGQPWWIYSAWAALFALFVLLSNQTLRAPIFNFDAGWYRVPFTTWISNFPAVPGLSNLNLYFGYGHFTDVLSALLTAPFSDGSGYRLISLLFLTAFAIDILIRTLPRLRSKNPEVWTLSTTFSGLSFLALLIITPNASIWVATPIVDLPVAIMFLAAIAYQLEAFNQTKRALMLVSVALLAATSVLRPPYLVALVIVFLGFWLISYKPPSSFFRRIWNSNHDQRVLAVGVAVLFASSAIGTAVRTGFPFFPFSRFAGMASDWSIPLETLSFARSLNQMHSFVWTVSDPSQIPTITFSSAIRAALREPSVQFLIGSAFTAIVLRWLYRVVPNEIPVDRSFRYYVTGVWAAPASVVALTAWASAQPRFFWGPLIALGVIPLSVLIHKSVTTARRSRRSRVSVLLASLLFAIWLLVIFLQKGYVGSALLNPVMANGPGPLGSQTSSQAVGEVLKTDSGLEVFIASKDGQCWQQEPPCSFTLDERLELRGETLREGFRIRQ